MDPCPARLVVDVAVSRPGPDGSGGRASGSGPRRASGDGGLYRRADGMWAASVELPKVDGQRRRKVVYAADRAGVTAKVRELQDRLHKGLPPLDSQRTVGDFLTYWVDELLPGTVSDSTLQGYRHIVRRDLTPYLGHVVLSRLGPEQVFAMQQQLKARGLSPRTITYARAVLRRALRTAERWDLVHRNAAALVDPPRNPKREPEHLSQEQAQQLLAAAAHDPLGALYVLAVTTGLRKGELLALQWSEIDLEGGFVHVRATLTRITGRGMVRGAPKTASSRRTVPLPAMTVAALRRHRTTQRQAHLAAGLGWAEHDFVFSSRRGAPLDPSNTTGLWHAFTEQAGLGRVRCHALRHTAATVLLTAGVPLAVISKTLGHSGLAITADIYATVVPQLQRDAADAMQRALGGS